MTDRCRAPDWVNRLLMQRYEALLRGELAPAQEETPTEVERLAALGLDGSRLRRRYWKKVTEVEVRPPTPQVDQPERPEK